MNTQINGGKREKLSIIKNVSLITCKELSVEKKHVNNKNLNKSLYYINIIAYHRTCNYNLIKATLRFFYPTWQQHEEVSDHLHLAHLHLLQLLEEASLCLVDFPC